MGQTDKLAFQKVDLPEVSYIELLQPVAGKDIYITASAEKVLEHNEYLLTSTVKVESH